MGIKKVFWIDESETIDTRGFNRASNTLDWNY